MYSKVIIFFFVDKILFFDSIQCNQKNLLNSVNHIGIGKTKMLVLYKYFLKICYFI